MDLVIVARDDDALAASLYDGARAAGRDAVLVPLVAAAQLFTIDLGRATEVAPRCPLFLRPAFPPDLDPDLDRAAVHRNQEAHAAVWAAGRLTPAPVVNRPSHAGGPGRCSAIATVTQARCGVRAGPESFVSSGLLAALGPADAGRAIYVEDLGTLERAALPERPPGSGPYRIKEDAAHLGYELVTVVGDAAWRATEVDLPGADLAAASVGAATALDLAFCVVTWAVTAEGAHITRVDAAPTMAQVCFNWPAIRAALLARLS